MTQVLGGKTLHLLGNEFRLERLLPALIAGMLIGITEVIFAISLGGLIFSGEFSSYLPYGIGIALATAAFIMIATSLASGIPGVIGSTQDSSSVIMAVIVGGLVTTMPASRVEDKLATVLTAIIFITLLTGIFFLALGWFKIGGLVRFIPYPVVGGFLAGTGWLLLQGSFSVMTGMSLNFADISAFLRPDRLVIWVPGVIFALLLFLGLRRIRHILGMPGILIGAIVLFYLALLVTGTSIEEATRQDLLLGGTSGDITWQPLALKNLLFADWTSILGQGSNIAIILILSVVSLLLNASGLEVAIRRDIDLNRELRAAGIANLVSGLAGGMVGYHTLSLSSFSYRMGARGRLPGLVGGAICLAMLFAGSALLAYFPVPILGGLLLFLGLDFLFEWVIVGWSKLSRTDYAVVLLILIVIGATNFLVGVGVGLVAAIILFVVNYSRINVVHHALSGAEIKSNVERCAYHQRVLKERLGHHVYILELQGFLFFGTANALLDRIRSRVRDGNHPPLRYILLDFRRVTGMDSSAVISFVKGKQLAEVQEITLVLTHLAEPIRRRLEMDGLSEKDPAVHIFPDLDHGLEWCEEQLLDIEQVTTLHTPITLTAQLVDSGFEKTDTKRLLNYLERVEFKEGETIIHQGDEADRMYFVEMGAVSIYLELGKERVRLQTLGLGTAIGEPGLYLGTKSTASVIADMPVTAYRLTRAALTEMKEKEPELAATFHEFAAHLLSERLTSITRTLEAVLR
ncbi:MAG: SulP family inorganic anion transporter [Chloroflexota bacterium]